MTSALNNKCDQYYKENNDDVNDRLDPQILDGKE